MDDGEWRPEKEILKIDRAIRSHYKLPWRGGEMLQPWYVKKKGTEVKGTIEVAFSFHIEVPPTSPCSLVVERPEDFTIEVNGANITGFARSQWWVDNCFTAIALPMDSLKVGENKVLLKTKFHEGSNLEALYLIGQFGVRLDGTKRTIVALPEKIEVGDLVKQGFPFYSGRLTYLVPMPQDLKKAKELRVTTPKFTAACVKVDGNGMIAWQPYQTDVPGGKDILRVETVLTRRNTFGPLHQVPLVCGGYGPGNFVTDGRDFSLDYMLYPAGLLEPITVEAYKEDA